MLSILIPTYHYNIVPLVEEIHSQCIEANIKFEILAYDDGSKSQLNSNNNRINSLKNCVFKELPENIGRSAIRNLLGKEAKFDHLLFIDAGTFPKNSNFIKNYLAVLEKDMVNGGMMCLEKPPKKPYKLRWLFTKKKEYKAWCSSNFLIKKRVFEINLFDESIKNYGYEDVLFFESLKHKNLFLHQINNPVIHYADDDANTFIKKVENALTNLLNLIDEGKIKSSEITLLKYYRIVTKLKLQKTVVCFFKMTKGLLLKNFNSNYPSILLFDFYRLGYFCNLNSKE